MKLLTILSLLLLFTGCANKATEVNSPVYDETSLKQFVLSADEEALDSILVSVSKDSLVLRETIAYLENVFGNPNSNFRNEAYYAKLLQAKIHSAFYLDAEKEIASERLHLLQQNNIGKFANDFAYRTPAGKMLHLYDVKAPYTLLYFYNPECEACKAMKEALTRSEMISRMLKSGELKIVAIYTDKDETVWRRHLPQMPKEWIHGRDQEEYLYRTGVYDLRAIPTVYLLDADKKVLLKDVTAIAEIESKLLKTADRAE